MMLTKLFRIASISILSVFCALILFGTSTKTDALVKGWTPIEENLSIESNGDNPLGIVIVPSDENKDLDDQKSIGSTYNEDYPDLGSDQVFPFVAGLGPN